MKRRKVKITDDALRCFVLWCRMNDESIVFNIDTARGVLEIYAAMEDPA